MKNLLLLLYSLGSIYISTYNLDNLDTTYKIPYQKNLRQKLYRIIIELSTPHLKRYKVHIWNDSNNVRINLTKRR